MTCTSINIVQHWKSGVGWHTCCHFGEPRMILPIFHDQLVYFIESFGNFIVWNDCRSVWLAIVIRFYYQCIVTSLQCQLTKVIGLKTYSSTLSDCYVSSVSVSVTTSFLVRIVRCLGKLCQAENPSGCTVAWICTFGCWRACNLPSTSPVTLLVCLANPMHKA